MEPIKVLEMELARYKMERKTLFDQYKACCRDIKTYEKAIEKLREESE